MKRRTANLAVGVLALLCSSLGQAATVTVSPSNATPNVSDTFTITIHADTFPATSGPTLGLSFDSAVVQYVSGAVTGAFTGGFYLPHAAGGNPAATFDILAPADPAPLPVGSFDALVLTFQAIGNGFANIRIIDNCDASAPGYVSCDPVAPLAWFDANTFEAIPVTSYTQADVCVGGSCGATSPEITVTDSVVPNDDLDVPFGPVTVAAVATKTVTITNDGSATLNIGQLTALTAPFALINDMCSNQPLATATSCTVEVQFSPVATGPFPGNFDIPSDDADEPTVNVTVSGTGSATAVPNIVVTDSATPADDHTVAFGAVIVGDPAATATVTITNDGTGNLTLGALTGLAAPFSIQNDLCSNQVLASLVSCTVDVQFLPTADGLVSGVLSIPSDDSDEPTVTVDVNGTGVIVPVPDIRVTDSVAPVDDEIVPFGSITVGAISTQTVTVHNDGGVALAVDQINAGAGPPFSIANDGCSNTSVAIAGSCTFDIEFAPVAAAVFNGVINIPSDDPDTATVTVDVSGTGEPAMVPDITVTDSINPANDHRLPFGNIEENTTKQHTVTITNDGSLPLSILQVGGVNALAEPYTFDADGCSNQVLDPTETCEITIGFAPPEINVYNSAFDIPSDDPDEPSVIFAVSGGAQPGLRTDSPGESALDPWTLLGLGLAGVALKRRRRAAT